MTTVTHDRAAAHEHEHEPAVVPHGMRRPPTVFDLKQFRETMVAAGISQRQLARSIGIKQPSLHLVLSGRGYISGERWSRLKDSLHALVAQQRVRQQQGEARAAADTDTAAANGQRPVPNVRRL